jgi:hypothetical protein
MGHHHCSHWTSEGLHTGIGQLREALSLDPAFAKAHAALAAAHLLQGFWGLVPPGEAWPASRRAAQTALQLDDSLGEAHACLGAVLAITEFDWAEAAHEFDLALRWSPGDSQIRSWFAAFYLIPQGLLNDRKQDSCVRNWIRSRPLSAIPHLDPAPSEARRRPEPSSKCSGTIAEMPRHAGRWRFVTSGWGNPAGAAVISEAAAMDRTTALPSPC